MKLKSLTAAVAPGIGSALVGIQSGETSRTAGGAAAAYDAGCPNSYLWADNYVWANNYVGKQYC